MVPFPLTASPRSAANQLLAHMGLGPAPPALGFEDSESLQEENERLRHIIDILKRQIAILLKLNVA